MNPTSLLIEGTTGAEILGKFDEIQKQINELTKTMQPVQPPEYITIERTAEIFGVDKSTIFNWTRSGKLKKYGVGGRVFYRLDEVMASFQPL